jgi:hypothetical protein
MSKSGGWLVTGVQHRWDTCHQCTVPWVREGNQIQDWVESLVCFAAFCAPDSKKLVAILSTRALIPRMFFGAGLMLRSMAGASFWTAPWARCQGSEGNLNNQLATFDGVVQLIPAGSAGRIGAAHPGCTSMGWKHSCSRPWVPCPQVVTSCGL